jgi:argininosuccinate lyase
LHVQKASDQCPLGSGALAGSTLPLDRLETSAKLGFAEPTRNALDSVSDRDFILDFLHACAVGMMHLSRLAEEIVVWSSREWHFIRLSDAWTTGSSLMPNKKNPDMAELIRGKSGRAFANYMSLMTTMKALPLSYNRDLQEDKNGLFDSYDSYSDSLKIMTSMIGTMVIDQERFYEELKGDFCLATDWADHLVLKGIPFRQAHQIVGRVVHFAELHNKKFSDLTLEELKTIYPECDETDLRCFDIEGSLHRKMTFGSTNPKQVADQISAWRSKLI